MLARIRQLPGVASVGVTTIRPLRPNMSFLDRIEFAERHKPDPRYQQSANVRAATPDYFRAMGIPLIQGRFFNQQDIPGAPVAAVVNEAFVRQIVVTGSPLGMRVKNEDDGPHKYATIVGVMADARQGMNDTVAPEMLFNLNQILPTDSFYFLLNYHLDLVVRSHVHPDTLIPAITRIVHDLNPDVGVNGADLMTTIVADTMGSQTLAARLLTLFALAALVIAAAGLYGLLAYQVTQQLRDFGVRLALGAQRKDVLWLVLRRAMVRSADHWGDAGHCRFTCLQSRGDEHAFRRGRPQHSACDRGGHRDPRRHLHHRQLSTRASCRPHRSHAGAAPRIGRNTK
jgi:hypothetical protein